MVICDLNIKASPSRESSRQASIFRTHLTYIKSCSRTYCNNSSHNQENEWSIETVDESSGKTATGNCEDVDDAFCPWRYTPYRSLTWCRIFPSHGHHTGWNNWIPCLEKPIQLIDYLHHLIMIKYSKSATWDPYIFSNTTISSVIMQNFHGKRELQHWDL